MLFLIEQEHDPDHCPQRQGLAPETLFHEAAGVELRFAVADVPGHRLVFLVESESYGHLRDFLEPGRTTCTTRITPVTELNYEGAISPGE